jgi:hypothetical protein
MDVVWGETAGVKGQLWVLYPLLFILQVRFVSTQIDSLGILKKILLFPLSWSSGVLALR